MNYKFEYPRGYGPGDPMSLYKEEVEPFDVPKSFKRPAFWFPCIVRKAGK